VCVCVRACGRIRFLNISIYWIIFEIVCAFRLLNLGEAFKIIQYTAAISLPVSPTHCQWVCQLILCICRSILSSSLQMCTTCCPTPLASTKL
jgi:hypothetical protein